VTNVFGSMVEHWADMNEDGEVEMIATLPIDYMYQKLLK